MRFCAQDTKVFVCHEVFTPPFSKGGAVGELTHMRSMCVGVAETGELTHMQSMCVGVAETGGVGIYLLFWLLAGL